MATLALSAPYRARVLDRAHTTAAIRLTHSVDTYLFPYLCPTGASRSSSFCSSWRCGLASVRASLCIALAASKISASRFCRIRASCRGHSFPRFLRCWEDSLLLLPIDRPTGRPITKRLTADALRDFILRELDRVGLGHNTFTRPAVDLIVRSADGVLRQARNLCVGCLIEAVRSANKTIDIDNVNRVLMQPHWHKEADLVDY